MKHESMVAHLVDVGIVQLAAGRCAARCCCGERGLAVLPNEAVLL